MLILCGDSLVAQRVTLPLFWLKLMHLVHFWLPCWLPKHPFLVLFCIALFILLLQSATKEHEPKSHQNS